MLDQETLCQEIREVLHHLYDYPYLETHPLALRLWPDESGGASGRAQRLSRLLLESIEALNPPGAVPVDTSQVRFYALLVYRYVEERPLFEILRELGYSRSQFFREQQKAIMMLASTLADKLALSGAPPAPAEHLLDTEVERILVQQEPVDPVEVIQGVLQVVHRLAEQHAVTLVADLETDLPLIYTSRTLLRQVLLKSLSTLIAYPDVREIHIRMRRVARRLAVTLTTRSGAGVHLGGPPHLSLEPVQRLVEGVGGRWQGIQTEAETCVCHFDFPVDSQKTLLVIEDNEGFIRVFEGYLAGYEYWVIGATTGDEALKLAREMLPTAITLDIMMPNRDGWEILQALKGDPLTRSIPVIICSILEDPELAYSLGAAAYLQKPVSQMDILGVLSQLSDGEVR